MNWNNYIDISRPHPYVKYWIVDNYKVAFYTLFQDLTIYSKDQTDKGQYSNPLISWTGNEEELKAKAANWIKERSFKIFMQEMYEPIT